MLAALATVHPDFHAWCVLDRDALAAGEVWRLWTGHLAHFSASHLLVDAAVFVLLTAALLRSGERRFGRLVFLGGAGLGASLLVGDASLARYGGLSGLNALLLGRLAVRWFQAGGRLRVLGLALLAVAVGKFSLDSIGLGGTGVEFGSAAVVPCHLSHWLGLAWGLALPAANRPGADVVLSFAGGLAPAYHAPSTMSEVALRARSSASSGTAWRSALARSAPARMLVRPTTSRSKSTLPVARSFTTSLAVRVSA